MNPTNRNENGDFGDNVPPSDVVVPPNDQQKANVRNEPDDSGSEYHEMEPAAKKLKLLRTRCESYRQCLVRRDRTLSNFRDCNTKLKAQLNDQEQRFKTERRELQDAAAARLSREKAALKQRIETITASKKIALEVKDQLVKEAQRERRDASAEARSANKDYSRIVKRLETCQQNLKRTEGDLKKLQQEHRELKAKASDLSKNLVATQKKVDNQTQAKLDAQVDDR